MRLDRDHVAASVPMSEVAAVLGIGFDPRKSNPARGDFWAPCPFHQEMTPSFHVDDRKGYFYCFGCWAKGSVFDLVMLVEGLDFARALARVVELAGLTDAPPPRSSSRRPAPERPVHQAADQLQHALALWEQAVGREGEVPPLLASYLTSRGIDLEGVLRVTGSRLPATLRLHPGLPCREGGEIVHRGPAMLGLVGRRGNRVGIHRTWITADGRARLGDGRKVPKQWLGLTGSMRGQPVALTGPQPRMVVGEGIETVLAALGMLGARGEHGWGGEAALSLMALCGGAVRERRPVLSGSTGRPLPSATPAFDDLGAWAAPNECVELWILAEGSEKDPEALARHYTRARRRHALRRDGSPRRVHAFLPGRDWRDGKDFADMAAGMKGRMTND